MNVHKHLSLWEPRAPGAPYPVWKNQNTEQASGSHQVATGISHPPVAVCSLAAGPTPPRERASKRAACSCLQLARLLVLAGEPSRQPHRAHSGWARRAHTAPTWCEYTLVSLCHLLLSLKNYISICFHTPPPRLSSCRKRHESQVWRSDRSLSPGA